MYYKKNSSFKIAYLLVLILNLRPSCACPLTGGEVQSPDYRRVSSRSGQVRASLSLPCPCICSHTEAVSCLYLMPLHILVSWTRMFFPFFPLEKAQSSPSSGRLCCLSGHPACYHDPSIILTMVIITIRTTMTTNIYWVWAGCQSLC